MNFVNIFRSIKNVNWQFAGRTWSINWFNVVVIGGTFVAVGMYQTYA